MSISQTPTHNVKAVLKETGLTEHTLRAWERRYGMPMPQRSAGGHRLYSQRDIESIKWLIARQAEGLSISNAVEMWKEQIATGADPLAGIAPTSLSRPIASASDNNLDSIRSEWLNACLTFNESEAEQILNQAFALFPIEAVCAEVLQRALSEIGTQWHENKTSVQQEHFASALAMRRLDALVSAAPAPTREPAIVIGCPAGEWHTFAPLLLCLLLRRRGLHVIYLGANVPAEQFEETVQAAKADLVVLVVQQLTTAATLQAIAHILHRHKIRVGFGGRIFNIQPKLIHRISGNFLGASLDSAADEIESLLNETARSPRTEAIGETLIAAASYFESRRSQIEATLYESIHRLNLSPDLINIATEFLGDNILAALRLGDIKLVDREIDWVRDLLKWNHMPEQALSGYLNLYADAVTTNINGAGGPITEWLNKYK